MSFAIFDFPAIKRACTKVQPDGLQPIDDPMHFYGAPFLGYGTEDTAPSEYSPPFVAPESDGA